MEVIDARNMRAVSEDLAAIAVARFVARHRSAHDLADVSDQRPVMPEETRAWLTAVVEALQGHEAEDMHTEGAQTASARGSSGSESALKSKAEKSEKKAKKQKREREERGDSGDEDGGSAAKRQRLAQE